MACDFGAEGLCLIFLQTLHMKSNFVTFVPCNWFVIFFSNLDKYFMKNVNISYQQLFEDLQCYFCQFLPRYKIGMEIDICDCIDLIITHFNSLKVPSSPLVTLKASVWVTKFKSCLMEIFIQYVIPVWNGKKSCMADFYLIWFWNCVESSGLRPLHRFCNLEHWLIWQRLLLHRGYSREHLNILRFSDINILLIFLFKS